MGYRTLKSCIGDLRRARQLVEFNEVVDPYLELAAVQRRLYAAGAPAVLFTQPKGCRFPMLANLFGTEKRVEYIFRDGIEPLRKAIELGADPVVAAQQVSIRLGLTALKSFYYSRPKRVNSRSAPVLACETTLDQLPQLVSWQQDGGAYLTLPQVYTESLNRPGFGASNLGMYRVQISGNDYIPNEEAGLHYQIHRGIAGHHAESLAAGKPLPVSIFIGGAPAVTLAAVMPLPEGMSELIVAGILGQHRIPFVSHKGTKDTKDFSFPSSCPLCLCERNIYAEADFCIVGTLHTEMKPEGFFGDHLGYYSLKHDFPVLKVHRVYHRKDAIFPFTVVGRPPQEDTQFGHFIHNLVGDVVPRKLPGVRAVHAVDEAGVHPLLLAMGRESYLPLDPNRRAAELHTLAHAILGYGQLSLAKYLFLAAEEDDPSLSVYDTSRFLQHILQRADWREDVHFVTRTTADTLDYTDSELHRGSKLFVTVSGKPRRYLAGTPATPLPESLPCKNPRLAMPGVLCVEDIDMSKKFPDEIPLIVLVDNSAEATASLRDFLWTTFTKSDPASDVRGIGEFIENKHWGCTGALVIDAKRKPHHAPELVELPEVARRADEIAEKILRR
ncbi:MAG: UbiD family decarboxylase [Planctomycetaceae bacterium]|nr:UbiD family decarboxylase [Planctomycetaceae bacterium]